MKIKDCIEIIEREKTCVLRAESKQCSRECAHCDLVLPAIHILSAYDKVLDVLRQHAGEEEA